MKNFFFCFLLVFYNMSRRDMSPQRRRRRLLADVICDAVGLVEDKYVTSFAHCLFVTFCSGTALDWEWDKSARTVGWR
jgi:hypothetical protein